MAKDPFLAAIEELERMPRGYSARWTPERRYVEENLKRINDMRLKNKHITFEMLCESVSRNGGPDLDPVKLQNALYRVNMERNPDQLKHFAHEMDEPVKKKTTKKKKAGRTLRRSA
jgi:hypothetical protein